MIRLPYSYQIEKEKRNYLLQVADGFTLFFTSAIKGFQIVLSRRRFVWLLPGYARKFIKNFLDFYKFLLIPEKLHYSGTDSSKTTLPHMLPSGILETRPGLRSSSVDRTLEN